MELSIPNGKTGCAQGGETMEGNHRETVTLHPGQGLDGASRLGPEQGSPGLQAAVGQLSAHPTALHPQLSQPQV